MKVSEETTSETTLMGYCYEHRTNRLCCDKCGNAGGVRKRACPCGYCPATALCQNCNKEVRVSGQWKEWHKNCQASQDEMARRDLERQTLIQHGQYVRCSALNADDASHSDRVHVLFEGGQGWTPYNRGACVGRYMRHATYDAIPLLQNATIQDYERFGDTEPAPSEFHYATTPELAKEFAS